MRLRDAFAADGMIGENGGSGPSVPDKSGGARFDQHGFFDRTTLVPEAPGLETFDQEYRGGAFRDLLLLIESAI